jgi:dTDP-3,4-didehydro-2,6-dideoxy-alpha-D-glucose 3-reductase
MRILVLGNSNIFNRKVFPALKKFKNLKIEIASRRKLAHVSKVDKYFSSYSKALKNTKAKLIYISLINSHHYKWAKKSLEHNKHIIVDKPLTLNLKQTLKLILLAKKKKLFLSEAIVFHYHKQFTEILSKVNFKSKTKINTYFHIPKLDKNNFRNYPDLGGGCFQDMSSYAVYMMKFFFKKNNFDIKKFKNTYYNKNSKSFSFVASYKNLVLKSSFSFNKKYINRMTINSNNINYKINYIFSPPVDQNLIVSKVYNKSKKSMKIFFKTQNTFYTFFNMVFSLIKKKKFNYFYKELEQTAKLKNEII